MDKDQVAAEFARKWPPGRKIATRADLCDAGLGRRIMAEALEVGLLQQLRRGVYMPRHLWLEQKPWERDKLLLLAHAVDGGNSHIYTHFSAAMIHGLTVWGRTREIHVNLPYQGSVSRRRPEVHHHVSALGASELTVVVVPGVGVVRVTTLVRTVVDCLMTARYDQAVVIGDSALARGVDPEEIRALLITMEGRRGVRRARKALAAMNPLSESPGESRTRLLIAELPIEPPELQLKLQVKGREYRPDFAWRRIKLIVEFDGDTKYLDFRPTAQALIQERERENALMEAGWRFVRIKWHHLDSPDEVRASIMAAYQAARFNKAA